MNTNNLSQRNNTISLLRVFSMILILICHTIEYIYFIPGHSHLDQIFTVGVHTFFIISGFLYGNKTITAFKSWYIARLQRVYLPVAIIVIADVVILMMLGVNIPISTFFYFLFNIHGLTYLLYLENLPMIQNLVIIWFSAVIMVCYLLIPLLQIVKEKIFESKSPNKKCAIIIGVGLAIELLLMYFQVANLRTVFLFVIGYFMGMLQFNENNTKLSGVIVFGFFTLVLQGLRIVIRLKIDGVAFYDTFRAVSHYALGLYIFYFFYYIKKVFPSLIDMIGSSKIIMKLDSYSYYIFLTHGIFCKGDEFNVFTRFHNLAISFIAFITFTIIASVLLKLITDTVNKQLDKLKKTSSNP